MAIDQENEEAQEASSTMKLTSSREMISEISSTITSNSLAREASTRVQAPSQGKCSSFTRVESVATHLACWAQSRTLATTSRS